MKHSIGLILILSGLTMTGGTALIAMHRLKAQPVKPTPVIMPAEFTEITDYQTLHCPLRGIETILRDENGTPTGETWLFLIPSTCSEA